MLGGEIDWQGLPVVCELVGVEDMESVILDLITIRKFQNDQQAEKLKK